MNFDDITKYFGYLETISLILGVVLVGGAIALPDLNKIFEDLLANHAIYLALLLVLAVGWLFFSIFTGDGTQGIDVFMNVFVTLFAFSLFVLGSLLVTIMFTGKVNWMLIFGLTFILHYVFSHYIKIL